MAFLLVVVKTYQQYANIFVFTLLAMGALEAYLLVMDKKIISDPTKNQANIEKHGVPLSLAGEVLANRTAEFEDKRYDYQEVRNITFGYVDERLYVAVWTERDGVIRSISVRKANKREVQHYG